MRNIVTLLTVFIFILGCSKDKALTKLYDKETNDVAEENANLQSKLLDSSKGWIVYYAPSDKADTVAIWLKFKSDSEYEYTTDHRNYLEEHTSNYSLGGIVSPEIIFGENNSVWETLKADVHGATKFKLKLENNEIFMVRADGFDSKSFKLRKFEEKSQQEFDTRVQLVRDQILWEEEQLLLSEAVRLKVKQLVEMDNAYFNALELGSFKAHWSLDTLNSLFSVTWREGNALKTTEEKYDIYPNGIAFENPINLGTVTADSLQFGIATDNTVAISEKQSNTEGSIGQKHTPMFEYPNAIEFALRINQPTYKIRWQFYGEDPLVDIGSELLSEYTAISTIPGLSFGGANLYVNNATSGHNRYGMVITLQGGAKYLWYKSFALDDGSIVSVDQDQTVPESSLSNNGFKNMPQAQQTLLKDFWNKLFDGGITVWPTGVSDLNGNQTIRFINRSDSKIFITMKMVNMSAYPSPVFID